MKRLFSVKIHPAGLIVYAAAFLLMDSHLVLAASAALALHEGAHLLAMCLCGMRGCTIELTPFGGMADLRNFDSYQAWKRILAAASGVAASLIAAKLCLQHAPRTAFWHAFFQANLSLGLLNVLPAWPLDGARVLAALASYVGAERLTRRILSWMTILLGIALTALGLAGVWHGILNPGLLVTGPYLCYAARAERVSDRVRQMDGMNSRWQDEAMIPAEIWAAPADCAAGLFALLLGRGKRGRYQVMLAVDPASGSIRQCWTEKEMMNSLMKTGSN